MEINLPNGETLIVHAVAGETNPLDKAYREDIEIFDEISRALQCGSVSYTELPTRVRKLKEIEKSQLDHIRRLEGERHPVLVAQLQAKVLDAQKANETLAHENKVYRDSLRKSDMERAELRELLKLERSDEIKPAVFALMKCDEIHEKAYGVTLDIMDIVAPHGVDMEELPAIIKALKEDK